MNWRKLAQYSVMVLLSGAALRTSTNSKFQEKLAFERTRYEKILKEYKLLLDDCEQNYILETEIAEKYGYKQGLEDCRNLTMLEIETIYNSGIEKGFIECMQKNISENEK